MKVRGHEPVQVERKRYGFLPEVLICRGQRHDVWSVERCWTQVLGKGAKRQEQRYFRVRCARGTLEIYHDLQTNTWQRVR